jgi:pyruvate decarboxylase
MLQMVTGRSICTCIGSNIDPTRRINGAGAVVTTFGPGELSNMCPIAGAYTEFVPIAHIVGKSRKANA